MTTADTLIRLRQSLGMGSTGEQEPRIAFGEPAIDQALGGGLRRAALHEIFAAGGADAPAAEALALALTLRAGGRAVWVRQEMAARETGELYARGLAAFGADPSSLLLVRVRDALSALRAANEALRCPALGAVVLDLWGAPKALDLTATRRLARAAEISRVPAFLVRASAEPMPSAAETRWRVRAAPSRALEANAPGAPVFDIDLERHRAGLPPKSFCVEWDRDRCVFLELPLSRAVAAAAARRPAAALAPRARRKAG